MARRKKRSRKSALPKGAYRLPTGGYVTESVYRSPDGKRLRVRGVVKDNPDMRLLMHALLDIAREQLNDQDEDGPKAA